MFTHSKGDRSLSMAAGVWRLQSFNGAINLDGWSDGGAIAFPWLLCSGKIFRMGMTVLAVPRSVFYR
jgi:hypothetical protein